MFKLGAALGGRNEVLEAPAAESLKFMELQLQKEEDLAAQKQHDYWMQFLIASFAQIPMGEESAERKGAREAFVDTIKPKKLEAKEKKPQGWANIPAEAWEENAAVLQQLELKGDE